MNTYTNQKYTGLSLSVCAYMFLQEDTYISYPYSVLGWISLEADSIIWIEKEKFVWEVIPGITSRGAGREESLNSCLIQRVTAIGSWDSLSAHRWVQNAPQCNPTWGAKKLGSLSIGFHLLWLKAVLKDFHAETPPSSIHPPGLRTSPLSENSTGSEDFQQEAVSVYGILSAEGMRSRHWQYLL